MDNEKVAELIREGFGEDSVEVVGEGGHIHVTVVSNRFAGLAPVRRQQLVYQHLSGLIASGEVHAVTMTTLTDAEQEQKE